MESIKVLVYEHCAQDNDGINVLSVMLFCTVKYLPQGGCWPHGIVYKLGRGQQIFEMIYCDMER